MNGITKKLSAGILATGLSLLPLQGLAAPLEVPAHGIVLSDAEKQAYISEKMTAFFGQDFSKPQPTFTAPDGWHWTRFKIGNVPVERMRAETKESDRVILHLHGGGYILGMSDGHRLLALRQAVLTRASEVYYVEYRLAPQHVYPAALEDAVTVYQRLLARGIEPQNIILVGDSAGGNLALELVLYLKEHNIAQPAVLALASPWASLESDFVSRTANAAKDQILGEGTPLYEAVGDAAYAGALPREDARLSPLHADLSGLPPMLIQTGGNEISLTEN